MYKLEVFFKYKTPISYYNYFFKNVYTIVSILKMLLEIGTYLLLTIYFQFYILIKNIFFLKILMYSFGLKIY